MHKLRLKQETAVSGSLLFMIYKFLATSFVVLHHFYTTVALSLVKAYEALKTVQFEKTLGYGDL